MPGPRCPAARPPRSSTLTSAVAPAAAAASATEHASRAAEQRRVRRWSGSAAGPTAQGRTRDARHQQEQRLPLEDAEAAPQHEAHEHRDHQDLRLCGCECGWWRVPAAGPRRTPWLHHAQQSLEGQMGPGKGQAASGSGNSAARRPAKVAACGPWPRPLSQAGAPP